MNTLKITNLNKRYTNGVQAINNVSLEINNGMFGLLGPNGAGKSSLMRTIATLQQPDSGTIEFNGINILNDPLFMRQNLGYLPQEFGVYTKISAYKLLEHLAVLKGIVDKKSREEQIMSLLGKTNLLEHRDKSVHTFSGGMRQRFGIAQTLLGNPKMIIVDEPTAGLDPEERNRFNNLLSEIGENIIVLLSTHIVEDVRDLCTNMGIITNGTLITQCKPEEAIKVIEGTLWAKTIHKNELALYQANMNVISAQLYAGQMNIHVSATTHPGNDFVAIKPNLEDVYFSILLENNVNKLSHV